MQVSMKAMRINAQMSQAQVAKELGITTKTVQNWEKNVCAPDAMQFARLCRLFNCSRDDIFLPDSLAKSEASG